MTTERAVTDDDLTNDEIAENFDSTLRLLARSRSRLPDVMTEEVMDWNLRASLANMGVRVDNPGRRPQQPLARCRFMSTGSEPQITMSETVIAEHVRAAIARWKGGGQEEWDRSCEEAAASAQTAKSLRKKRLSGRGDN